MATDRPFVSQRYLNRLALPDDMPDVPWVQWRVENLEEMADFIEKNISTPLGVNVRVHHVPGCQLVLQTEVFNSDIQLSPGDCLVIHQHNGRPRLGVVRARESVPFREADGIKDHDNPIFMDPKDKVISH